MWMIITNFVEIYSFLLTYNMLLLRTIKGWYFKLFDYESNKNSK